jgi:hypothetical protein
MLVRMRWLRSRCLRRPAVSKVRNDKNYKDDKTKARALSLCRGARMDTGRCMSLTATLD